MWTFIPKKAFKLGQNKLEKMQSEKSQSSPATSLCHFWRNTHKLLNAMVQSQKSLKMLDWSGLWILRLKDEPSLQRVSNYYSEKTQFPN